MKYGLCSKFNCLPNNGGLLDQTEETIKIFGAITAALGEKRELDRSNREWRSKQF